MHELDNLEESKQLLVHELTHALVSVDGHSPIFWKINELLLKEFLGGELSDNFKKMKADYARVEQPRTAGEQTKEKHMKFIPAENDSGETEAF